MNINELATLCKEGKVRCQLLPFEPVLRSVQSPDDVKTVTPLMMKIIAIEETADGILLTAEQ